MFYIPVENYVKFEKKVNSIRNKGANISLTKGEPIVLAVTENRADINITRDSEAWKMSEKAKFFPVEVSGFYKINDWEFVATLEHTPNDNIIRSVNSDVEIPLIYRACSPVCEHCNKIRSRKDTYLIRNTKDNTFKQVGKACLKDYTQGLDAKLAGELASIINDPDEYFENFYFVTDSRIYYNADEFKRATYNFVKENGYDKEDPDYVKKLIENYHFNYNAEVDLTDMNKWVSELDTTNNYFHNASTAWKLEDLEEKHLKLVASLINTYFKDLERIKIREIKALEENTVNSDFVGNIGDKIEFKVLTTRVLYTKEFTFGYNNYSSTAVQRVVGTDGNIYIWATNKMIEQGDKIKATIKGYKEYNGEKQTVITRGKIS